MCSISKHDIYHTLHETDGIDRYIFDAAAIPTLLKPVAGAALAPLTYFTKSPKQGAQTQIFLAASHKIGPESGGRYYDNSAEASTSAAARDRSNIDAMWKASETLTGVSYGL